MVFAALAIDSIVDWKMRQRGPQLPYDPQRKRRTNAHVIADLSYNFLERKILLRGHWLDSPQNDYGIDAVMFHHDAHGEVENGEVRFQLKATEVFSPSADGTSVAQRVAGRDLRFWHFEPYPVVLMLYDAVKNRGFWLHVQEYVREHAGLQDSDAESVTLQIPLANQLTLRAIDRFRKLSLETVARFHQQL